MTSTDSLLKNTLQKRPRSRLLKLGIAFLTLFFLTLGARELGWIDLNYFNAESQIKHNQRVRVTKGPRPEGEPKKINLRTERNGKDIHFYYSDQRTKVKITGRLGEAVFTEKKSSLFNRAFTATLTFDFNTPSEHVDVDVDAGINAGANTNVKTDIVVKGHSESTITMIVSGLCTQRKAYSLARKSLENDLIFKAEKALYKM